MRASHLSRITRILACASLLAAGQAGAAVFTVGADGICTHASIQAAIAAAAANGPGEDEVRVTVGTWTQQSLQVTDQSLLLSGGWSSCAADATQGNRTTLVGGPQVGSPGTNAVLLISATDNNQQTVTLRGFVIRDGHGGPDGNGAGIDAGGAVRLVLQETEVFANQASGNGGGIAMQGPQTGFGGILELHAGVRVGDNQAGGYGGGIYLDRATLRMRADRTEIGNNVASWGGGIAALRSSIGIGNAGEPEMQDDASGALITSNGALVGGGVYLDQRSLFDAHELRLSSNLASRMGGGVYATGNAQVQFARDYPNAMAVRCQGNACSRIQGNQAGNGCPGTSGEGGGLYLDNASAYLSQVEILDNCAWGSPALISWGTRLNMEGVVVARNRLSWRDGINYTGRQAITFASRNGNPLATANLAFATFADNVEVKGDGSTVPASATSVISNSGGWQFTVQGVASADLLVLSEGANAYGNCNKLAVPRSDFFDAANGDYRPQPQGSLVDACAQEQVSYEYRDPRLVARCTDHSRPDQGGKCDIGAYETPYVAPADRIFANDFE
ncbi:MAG: hypothetical protein GXC76_08070 [Rhodanobacteraceae bacterium]|jgi:hypothetical protein|nr:hypothetical protein [Rhodanobacteraceae bacterium]